MPDPGTNLIDMKGKSWQSLKSASLEGNGDDNPYPLYRAYSRDFPKGYVGTSKYPKD